MNFRQKKLSLYSCPDFADRVYTILADLTIYTVSAANTSIYIYTPNTIPLWLIWFPSLSLSLSIHPLALSNLNSRCCRCCFDSLPPSLSCARPRLSLSLSPQYTPCFLLPTAFFRFSFGFPSRMWREKLQPSALLGSARLPLSVYPVDLETL